ncbi:hypothetical protein ANACOL_03274 [Anaerotruncus colihominis DSM 17241]|uniref:Uncharacterized protein n=1 Tax=Anaerotruncus colihominis DSM 17241 TaxID=445972 RepID=B0PEP6_9FIRM|nr:hypothetical protein ANACOL_03274 [Anaerotruncus colihominis DSM 17241]
MPLAAETDFAGLAAALRQASAKGLAAVVHWTYSHRKWGLADEIDCGRCTCKN